MNDIAELERRITDALDRIAGGLGRIQPVAGSGDGDTAEIAELREAYEAEKTVNSQLEERVRAIRDRQEQTVGALEAEVARLREAAARTDSELARVKRVNSQLRENNQALREANEKGVGDAHLVNKSMMTELDSLRLRRETDRAELDAILDELKPLMGGVSNA